jgi:mRNA interferase HigB
MQATSTIINRAGWRRPSRLVPACAAFTRFPEFGNRISILWKLAIDLIFMIVIGTDVVERYFAARTGHRGIKAARAQYDAWRAIADKAQWKTPEDVKRAHPKARILKGGRVVFNIKANDYRLITLVQYRNGVLMIRFFGTHSEYDKVDAETV